MNRKTLLKIVAIIATLVTLGLIVYYYYRKWKEEVIICDIAHQPYELETLSREIYKNSIKVAGKL